MNQRGYLFIDENKIISNYQNLKAFLPDNQHMICIVKCDGYGHGIKEAITLQSLGANFFGVACYREAKLLREAGIKGDILILSHTLEDEMEGLIQYDIIQTIGGYDYGLVLINKMKQLNKQVRCHFKIDTGMHRLGMSSKMDINQFLDLYQANELKVEGALSHLAVGDSFNDDDIRYCFKQKELFDDFLKRAKEVNMHFEITHLQASASIINYPQWLKDYTHCRPGILFLGFDSGEMIKPYPREEVISLISHVEKVDILKKGESIGYGRTYIASEDIYIATIPVGYGDGIPRNYPGDVIINDQRCPIVGRISMDQLCVKATSDIKIGDKVYLLGNGITLKEMADKANTIPNEIATKFTNRLERVYGNYQVD